MASIKLYADSECYFCGKKPIYARNLCHNCYCRWNKTGTVEHAPKCECGTILHKGHILCSKCTKIANTIPLVKMRHEPGDECARCGRTDKRMIRHLCICCDANMKATIKRYKDKTLTKLQYSLYKRAIDLIDKPIPTDRVLIQRGKK